MFAEPTGAPAVLLERSSLLQLALAQGCFFCSLHLPFTASESTNFTIRKPSEQTKIIHILRHDRPRRIFFPLFLFFCVCVCVWGGGGSLCFLFFFFFGGGCGGGGGGGVMVLLSKQCCQSHLQHIPTAFSCFQCSTERLSAPACSK